MAANDYAAFAQYYKTAKYADLEIIVKPDYHLHVHRLVVCSQSPVLDAQAANMSVVKIDEDEAVFKQMIEWMHGIDDKNLLIEGKSIDQIIAMGQDVVYGELMTMAELAHVAEKYCVISLKDQAFALIQPLVTSLTSPHLVLRAIQMLTPHGTRGSIHQILTSRAFEFTLVDNTFPLHTTGTNERSRLTPAASSVSNNDMAMAIDEDKPEININKSALRSAHRVVAQEDHENDSDSDYRPLINLHRKRKRHADQSLSSTQDNAKTSLPDLLSHLQKPQNKKQSTSTSKSKSPPTPKDRDIRALKQIATWAHYPPSFTPQAPPAPPAPTTQTPTPKRRPRLSPTRISTAIPPKSPPEGPHCHCHASDNDPYLVQCTGCNNRYHPRCVGKGRYARGTYNGDPDRYMKLDVEVFEDEYEAFKCGDCETGFFGSK
ncbi:hypothetical protein Q7P37_002620 [Cladosporium fusiforme]